MTRILIVDDHQTIRNQIRQVIQQRQDWEVCGEAEDGREAIAKYVALRPQILVIDFNMPKLNGLQAARQILKESPAASILMLSVSDSRELIEEVKKTGIKGFCSKNAMEAFPDAVETILHGDTYFYGHPN